MVYIEIAVRRCIPDHSLHRSSILTVWIFASQPRCAELRSVVALLHMTENITHAPNCLAEAFVSNVLLQRLSFVILTRGKDWFPLKKDVMYALQPELCQVWSDRRIGCAVDDSLASTRVDGAVADVDKGLVARSLHKTNELFLKVFELTSFFLLFKVSGIIGRRK